MRVSSAAVSSAAWAFSARARRRNRQTLPRKRIDQRQYRAGALVDINRLSVKIQQIVIEHSELQKQFGAIAA